MTFKGTLLPYQPEAVERMCERGSMLVAYDLGLGKTVLTIAAIEQLMDSYDVKEPGLIICLSSLKYQWASQIERFTEGTSKAVVIDGSPTKRAEQYAQAMDWRNSGIDYVILNYEQVVNDWKHVSKLPHGFIVLDEATAIKGFRAKRSKYVKKLNSDYRFALTGTPIENGKPEELYSIMQFVDENVLGRYDLFDNTFIVRNNFGGVQRYRNLPLLHKTMSKAAVRKSQDDADVKPYLPDTIHFEPVRVKFDLNSARVYQRIVGDLLEDLNEAQDLFGSSFSLTSHYGHEYEPGSPADELRGRLMSKVTCMRMLCDHPKLLEKSANEFDAMLGTGSKYAAQLKADGLLGKLKQTPKLDALVDYVVNHLETDSTYKVVIFSVFVTTLDEIAARLAKYNPLLYSGKLDAKTKDANKTLFNENPANRVLISSDAGGYGVDLPAANLLVNYDLPWSSGAAIQRNGRIRRASTKWGTVFIQDLLMYGSIEERQHDMLQQKNLVARAIVDGEGYDDKGGVSMNVGTLRSFLTTSSVF